MDALRRARRRLSTDESCAGAVGTSVNDEPAWWRIGAAPPAGGFSLGGCIAAGLVLTDGGRSGAAGTGVEMRALLCDVRTERAQAPGPRLVFARLRRTLDPAPSRGCLRLLAMSQSLALLYGLFSAVGGMACALSQRAPRTSLSFSRSLHLPRPAGEPHLCDWPRRRLLWLCVRDSQRRHALPHRPSPAI